MAEQEQAVAPPSASKLSRILLRIAKPALAVLLPAWLLYLSFHGLANLHLEELATEILRERASTLGALVDGIHEAHLDRLTRLAENARVRSIVKGDPEARLAAARELERMARAEHLEVLVLDMEGRQLFPDRDPGALPVRRRPMLSLHGNPRGCVVGALVPCESAGWRLEYALPMRDASGEPRGALVGRFEGSSIAALIEPPRDGNTGFAVEFEVLDSEGILLASSLAPEECGRSCKVLDAELEGRLVSEGYLLPGEVASAVAPSRPAVRRLLAASGAARGAEVLVEDEEKPGLLRITRTAPWIISLSIHGGPFQRLGWVLAVVVCALTALGLLLARLWRPGVSQRIPSSGVLLVFIGIVVTLSFALGGWVLRLSVVQWAEEATALSQRRASRLVACSLGQAIDLRLLLLEEIDLNAVGDPAQALAGLERQLGQLLPGSELSLVLWPAGEREPRLDSIVGEPLPRSEALALFPDPRLDDLSPDATWLRLTLHDLGAGGRYLVLRRLAEDRAAAVGWIEATGSRFGGMGSGLLSAPGGAFLRTGDGRVVAVGDVDGATIDVGRAEWERVPLVDREIQLCACAGMRRYPDGFESLIRALTLAGAMFSLVAGGFTYMGARAVVAHREASRRDPLTALPNRRTFNEMLDEELAKAVRYDRPLSLAILDLDHFKAINDTLGHRAGDRVLQGAAEILASTVRRSDRVFRFGGEEFAILMPETEELAATVALERVRVAFEHASISYGRGTVFVRSSIGVTGFVSGETSEDIVVRADAACYGAKARGRNQVILFRVEADQVRELSVEEVSQKAVDGPSASHRCSPER